MVYLGYGLIAVVALVTVAVSVREITNRDLSQGKPESARFVLHTNRKKRSVRPPSHRSW